MLVIQNVNKLLNKVVGVWIVFDIHKTSTAYLIQLHNIDGDKKQINLERTPVKSNENLYELWMWDKTSPTGAITQTATPKRIMLKLGEIKDMNNLMGSMEFLIRE